ncbi:hypothetical protein RSK60_1670002 [Ralstonia solanacearum K60]|nr:hypothetical protein RSK60_1670002 [Ralstonia solanacearum K60]
MPGWRDVWEWGAGLPATRAIEAFCDLPAMGGAGTAQPTTADTVSAHVSPRGGHAGPMPATCAGT